MKKTIGIFSLAVLLFSSFTPSFTYATKAEDEAKQILEDTLNTMDYLDNIDNIILNNQANGPILQDTNEAVLISGIDFVLKIKKLANSSVTNYGALDTTINKILRYTGNSIPETKVLLSKDDSVPVYGWYENIGGTGIVYYRSDANKIYMNQDSSNMFYNMRGLEYVNLKEFDTSRVTNISSMFYNAGIKNLDRSNVNFSKVTNLNYLFQSNQAIENVDFSNIDFSSLENSSWSLFYDLDTLKTVNLSGAKFGKLKSMSYFFGYSNNLEDVNMYNADFSSLENTAYMFIDNYNLINANLSNVNFSKVTSVQGMFMGASSGINVDFSFTNFSGLVNVSNTDHFIPSNIINISFEGTNLENLKSMRYRFQNKNSLNSVNFSGTILSNLEDMSNMFQSNNGVKYVDFSHTDLSSVKTMQEMFFSSYGIRYVNFSGSNLENLTNALEMFQAARLLTGVNFHGVNMSGVNDVKYMFENTNNLIYADFGEAKLGTTMYYMFNSSNVEKINFSGADFSNVVNMENAFYIDKNLKKVDFTNITGSNNVTNMKYMFENAETITDIDLSYFDMGKVTNMYGMFQNCYLLENVNFGDNEIGQVQNMYAMFEFNRNLRELDLSNFNTINLTGMSYMFEGDLLLNTIYVSDKFTTNNVISSDGMFNNTPSLPNWNSDNPKDKTYARIGTNEYTGYFTSILDKPYNITFISEGEVINQDVEVKYTPRQGGTLLTPSKIGYELVGWVETGTDELFTFNENIKGDKTLYAVWKSLEEKSEENTNNNVTYTNNTTVTVGDEEDVNINDTVSIEIVTTTNLPSNLFEDTSKTTIKEEEIEIESTKKAEYQGGVEVYIEKTENNITERLEGTAEFSHPIAVKIPLENNVEGNVKVQVKHEGEIFGFKGLTLNPENLCNNGEAINDQYNGEDVAVTDKNGNKYATIYTCSASIFVAYTEGDKPQPSAGGGRVVNKTTNTQVEQEHNSAETENTTEQNNKETKSNQTTNTPTIQEQIKKVEGKSLTRGEIAVMTDILLEVYPQLTEGRELQDVAKACSSYADEQEFTKDEKKAITRLCKLSIMGIHNDDNQPLDEFLVKQKASNGEFATVMDRVVSSYNEKDLSTIKDALKKLENNEENVIFGTVYEVFMSIKNIFN